MATLQFLHFMGEELQPQIEQHSFTIVFLAEILARQESWQSVSLAVDRWCF